MCCVVCQPFSSSTKPSEFIHIYVQNQSCFVTGLRSWHQEVTGAGHLVTTPHTWDPLVWGGGDQLQTGEEDGRAPSWFVAMVGRTDNPNEVVILIDIQLMLKETFLVSWFWKIIKILMVGIFSPNLIHSIIWPEWWKTNWGSYTSGKISQ